MALCLPGRRFWSVRDRLGAGYRARTARLEAPVRCISERLPSG